MIRQILAVCTLAFSACSLEAQPAAPVASDQPVSLDPRIVVEPFALAPDIVHPIALDFDARGRLLVIESHTHFRPANYQGPRTDRIRMMEDTNGDGRADRITTFFEGTSATMDIATHPNGAVYVATRNELLRLRDTNGDGKADDVQRLAFLETAGNYPHNGLSGIVFDERGDLHFGMGENLGAPYTLKGADGKSISGGGEGGNVFHCTTDGKQLRQVATGFWNPFGAGRDIFGRIFIVDNDPDASPPCRMVQLKSGADYGFQFRYGRSGRHVFQSWNGELPGTLPYVTGTGESPCEVISYESDGLPAEYRGSLLVPAWADHRLERYVLKPQGAGFIGERVPFVQGGKEFRPSGLAVAPDGSLYMTDWVSRSYELHGKGAVWRVRLKSATPRQKPASDTEAFRSPHRPTRDQAARTLTKTESGRSFLRSQLQEKDVRSRAAALEALIVAEDTQIDLVSLATHDPEPGIREMAVRALVARKADVQAFLNDQQPASVRVEALVGLQGESARPQLLKALADADPYLRHAATQRLADLPELLRSLDPKDLGEARQRIGWLLAWQASGLPDSEKQLRQALQDPDPEVRFLAIKWIADEKRTAFRSEIVQLMEQTQVDPRSFIGLATALARLDDRSVSDDTLASYFLGRLGDAQASTATRLMAIRSIPTTYNKLKSETFTALLTHENPAIRLEALRALKDRADPKTAPAVEKLLADNTLSAELQAQALLTLSLLAPVDKARLLKLAIASEERVAGEALRQLAGQELSSEEKQTLRECAQQHPGRKDLVARVLGEAYHAARPSSNDLDGWLARLSGPADADTGRRVFENTRLTNCSSCHRVDGRGNSTGPDLSQIGRTERRWILESILQPSSVVAPHFQAWKLELADGRVRTGLLVRTYLDESEYVDETGTRFKLEAQDIVSSNPISTSIMPEKLLDKLTDQEVRDLLAFLETRK